MRTDSKFSSIQQVRWHESVDDESYTSYAILSRFLGWWGDACRLTNVTVHIHEKYCELSENHNNEGFLETIPMKTSPSNLLNLLNSNRNPSDRF